MLLTSAVIRLPPWSEARAFLPEIILSATMMGVLLAPVLEGVKRHAACTIVAFFGTSLAIAALVEIGRLPTAAHAGMMPFANYFGGLLVLDPFAWFMKLVILGFTLLVIFLRSLLPPGETQRDGPEFFLLLLGAALGMCVMVGTANLMMIFLAVEMASLPSYILAGFQKTQRAGAEAALKYVLVGAVATGGMLYGISLLYGLAGSLDLRVVATALAATHGASRAAAGLGILALIGGIGFKCAMVPMHFWCPDVFEGSSLDVAAFLSVASEGAGLALLLRVAFLLSGPHQIGGPGPAWPGTFAAGVIATAGVISAFWGNLAAFGQKNIKRLLAYSSIAHSGYMMLGIALVAAGGQAAGATALLFYLAMYLFTNGGAFVAAGAIYSATGSEQISEYAALSRRAPLAAFAMTIFLLSLTGIPLTVGFAMKLRLFLTLFNAHSLIGYIGVGTLAVNTVIAAFYYLRVIRQMYLVDSDAPALIEIAPITIFALLLVLPTIGLFIVYGPASSYARSFARLYRPHSNGVVALRGR